MKISLSTSLHLNHGGMSLDVRPGDPLPMQNFVPVGLLCLKSAIDQANIGVDIGVVEINSLINPGLNLRPWHPLQRVSRNPSSSIPNDDQFYDHIVDAILQRDPSLVGLMTDADSLHHTIIIAEYIKRRSQEILICLGGPAASPISRYLLETFPFIDFVVRGEGEQTFVELISTLQEKRLPFHVLGLTWRDKEIIVENAPRPLIEDLDELPIPAFDAYDMATGASLYLDVGRGCPFKCHFCATAPYWNRKYRIKSIDRIVEEMVLVRDCYGRRHINFSHDIFTYDREWTRQFCERLVNEKISVTWTCSTRTDIITPDILNQMAQAGCVEIYYGIESGSNKIQKQIHKNLNLDWSRKIVQATVEAGIRPITGFIVGYPMETRETLGDTLERFFDFLQLGKARAHLFTLCPFHESPIFREYGNTINRQAEYFDLCLTTANSQMGTELKNLYPNIFASTHRYATPELPENLVDASEELSAHLVVLKSIWPFLLPYYTSPLDLYTRWVDWVEADNKKRRPNSSMLHQGDAQDILRFIREEIERLGLANNEIADLIRYEQLKLDARHLRSPGSLNNLSELEIHSDLVIKRRCEYLAAYFQYDLASLLSGKRPGATAEMDDRWVIIAKVDDDSIDTLHVGTFAKHILDQTDRPRCIGEILNSVIDHSFRNSVEHKKGLQVIKQYIQCGLLTPEVDL